MPRNKHVSLFVMSGWYLLAGILFVEGFMPLFFTQAWRQTFEKLLQLKDGQIRFIGFVSVTAGILIFWLN